MADLLGGDDLLGAPAPQASASAEPDSSPAVLRAFATACRSPKGVLYEDDKIQIGWMEHQPYADRMGVVGFFFKNKTPGPFSCFTVAIPPAATLSLKLQDMNPNLPAGASANMGVQVRIEEPFPDPPVANISFVMGDGTPVQLALRVPIVVTKFSKGYAVSDAAQFSQMWQQAPQLGLGQQGPQVYRGLTVLPHLLACCCLISSHLPRSHLSEFRSCQYAETMPRGCQ